MTGYLLLHGAASTGWMWHRVEPALQKAGHRTAAPDLPSADPQADLYAYADVAYAAAAALGEEPIVVVAQSMAGLYAPLLPARRPRRRTDSSRLTSSAVRRRTGSAWRWTSSPDPIQPL